MNKNLYFPKNIAFYLLYRWPAFLKQFFDYDVQNDDKLGMALTLIDDEDIDFNNSRKKILQNG